VSSLRARSMVKSWQVWVTCRLERPSQTPAGCRRAVDSARMGRRVQRGIDAPCERCQWQRGVPAHGETRGATSNFGCLVARSPRAAVTRCRRRRLGAVGTLSPARHWRLERQVGGGEPDASGSGCAVASARREQCASGSARGRRKRALRRSQDRERARGGPCPERARLRRA
jgi:hypothetical protein